MTAVLNYLAFSEEGRTVGDVARALSVQWNTADVLLERLLDALLVYKEGDLYSLVRLKHRAGISFPLDASKESGQDDPTA